MEAVAQEVLSNYQFCPDCTPELMCEDCRTMPELVPPLERTNHIINNDINYLYYDTYNNIMNDNIINNDNPYESLFSRLSQSNDVKSFGSLVSKETEETDDSFECGICLDNINTQFSLTFECGAEPERKHKFCGKCSFSSLKRNKSCPLCRNNGTKFSFCSKTETNIKFQYCQFITESKCLSCNEKSQCQTNCGHKYCGNCIVSHLQSTQNCKECDFQLTSVTI